MSEPTMDVDRLLDPEIRQKVETTDLAQLRANFFPEADKEPRGGERPIRRASGVQAALRDVQQRARDPGRNQQQCAGRARWRAATLLPLLQRANGDAQEFSKPGLGEPCLLADAGERWDVDDATVLPALELPKAVENLLADLAPGSRRAWFQ